MSRRYSFDEGAEHYSNGRSPPPQLLQSSQSPPPPQRYDSPPHYSSPPPQPFQSPPHSPPRNPAAHPDSSFNRLRAARRYSRDREQAQPLQDYGEPVSPIASPPPPPPYRDIEGRIWGRELGYTNSAYSNITPGADNFGEQAAGGLAGVAMSVADANARESGMEALRNTPGYNPQTGTIDPRNGPAYGAQDMQGSYVDSPYSRPLPRQEISQTSLTPLGAAAFPPGMATPRGSAASRSPPTSFNHDPYVDNPYQRYSRNLDPTMASFDPNSIEDDGDDGLEYRHQNRGSLLSLGNNSNNAIPATAGGAAAGGVLGTIGGMVGRKVSGNGAGPQYDPVQGYGGSGTSNEYNMGPEKSQWLDQQSSKKKRMRWIIIVLVLILIVGAIVGGAVGGALSSQSSSASSTSSKSPNGQSATDDNASNGDLDKDSEEIKALMSNPNLHKVFPGIDYTPINTQYPECIKNPPSQNNVTRDLAVLSQLTNTIRLYGTDCNATQMVLHSIDKLGLNGTIKVWLGVWQDDNEATNKRQIQQTYEIFEQYGKASFVGVIVGNEVLFREQMTITELGRVISNVKANLTAMGINLPIASSDLGDDWTQALADEVDYVMANIHPFFAGVTAEESAGWTWQFWQNRNYNYKTDKTRNIISEVGWPSAGGKNCGAATTCDKGSVAGIDEMNTFMNNWVCQSLANSTNYFLFEAFDEPWKKRFNTPGKEWEDKWGLMDVNRELKKGVVIPDCGGKTIDS